MMPGPTRTRLLLRKQPAACEAKNNARLIVGVGWQHGRRHCLFTPSHPTSRERPQLAPHERAHQAAGGGGTAFRSHSRTYSENVRRPFSQHAARRCATVGATTTHAAGARPARPWLRSAPGWGAACPGAAAKERSRLTPLTRHKRQHRKETAPRQLCGGNERVLCLAAG